MTERAWHWDLTPERWRTFSIHEQLGNVGTEVDRAIRAHRSGDIARRDHAIDRALELIDLTATDERWRGNRRKEILRTREYFCRVFLDPTVESDAGEYLRKYFMYFALVARHDR